MSHQKNSKNSKLSKSYKIRINQTTRKCFNEKEDKKTLKTLSNTSLSTSLESLSIHSGESVFKTFVFNSKNDKELEKCIVFWENLLTKNIKPAKCVLLERKQIKKQPKIRSQKCKCNCENKDNVMWQNIYRDLQKQNLDKVKLEYKTKHNFCDDYIDSKTYVQKIEELNDWRSPTENKAKIASQLQQVEVKPELSIDNKIFKNSKINKITSQINQVSVQPQDNTANKSLEKQEDLSLLKQELSDKCQSNVEIENSCQKFSADKMPDVSIHNLQTIKSLSEDTVLQTNSFIEKSNTSENLSVASSPLSNNQQNKYKDYVNNNSSTVENITKQKSLVETKSSCSSCFCSIDCTCNTTPVVCECGCDVQNCICDQVFTTICKCEEDSCSCNASLDSIQFFKQASLIERDKREIKAYDDKAVQCHYDDEAIEDDLNNSVTLNEMIYCVICGHYNCFCN